MSLQDCCRAVEETIRAACAAAGRKREEITLVAVTKTRTVEEINALLPLGLSVIAENRVQELMEKFPRLAPGFDVQLIGQLQTNKVKYIMDKVSLIQSLDRLSLAAEIQKRAERVGKVMDCLIEINVGSELSKSGIAPEREELARFCEGLLQFPAVRVRGLMTVAPQTEDASAQRRAFARMRTLFEMLPSLAGKQADILSMGMSGDYEQAILEGTTMIRLGTALFGRRNYTISV